MKTKHGQPSGAKRLFSSAASSRQGPSHNKGSKGEFVGKLKSGSKSSHKY